MFAKLYSCLRYEKDTKSISGLTRHSNAYKKETTQIVLHQIQFKLYDKENILDWDLEDRSQLVSEIDYTKRDASNTLTKSKPWDRLLTSESLSSLKKEQFTRNKFPADTLILDIKYNHPRLQHKNSFYLFKDQLDYALAYYFVESKTTKSNVNKFLSDPLMTLLIEKLSYKNVDEQIKKLLEIPQDIPKNKQIEHKFDVKIGVSSIVVQEIAISLQNVVNCIKFLMGHSSFQHNQTYKPYHIYNQIKDRVYNKMHSRNGWQK